MGWIRLTIAATVFVTSCVGLGYLAEAWVLRHGWPGWVGGLLSAAAPLAWPVFVVGYTVYDARRYQALHPHDDAPGMLIVSVLVVGAPVLALAGVLPVRVGAFLARRARAKVSPL
ncbi:MAG TPA: hypothetical protein VF591_20200 [Pyrinomonadaceae bacterium]|jgi:hypothetical protein